MTEVNFDMSDFENFIKSVRSGSHKKHIEDATNEVAERWRARAVDRSPWDTRLMLESFERLDAFRNIDEYIAFVYNTATDDGVPYPTYVEYGHRLVRNGKTIGWVPGFFMLTKAKKDVEKDMKSIMAKHVRRAWEEL